MSFGVISVQAETETEPGVFTETFEGYKTGVNWLDTLDADGFVNAEATGVSEKTWTIYGDTFNGENAQGLVEVVEYPAGSGNYVLKLDTGKMPAGKWYRIRRNSVAGNDGLSRKNVLNGKKLVIKADFYVPSTFTVDSSSGMFFYDAFKTKNAIYYNGAGGYGRTYSGKNWYLQGVGSYGNNTFGRISKNLSMTTEGVAKEVKFIYDLTEYGTPAHLADTVRAFADGTIQTFDLGNEASNKAGGVVPAIYPQPSQDPAKTGEKVIDSWGGLQSFKNENATILINDFFGASLTMGQKDGKSDQYMYMDNLMTYYIEPFKQEGTITYGEGGQDAWYKGAIEIPFNNQIRETVTENYGYRVDGLTANSAKTATNTYKLSELVKLVNAETNEVVEVANVTTANDGKTLVVTPPKGLTEGTTYKIVADALFMDVEGQGLNQYSADQELTTFTAGADPYAHILYDIDFEADDLEKGVNWVEKTDGTTSKDTRYVNVEGLDLGAVTVTKQSGAGEHKIEVVDDPTGANNKVLALTSAGTNGKTTKITFNANGNTGIARSTMGNGKKLVYKAKIFIPAGFKSTESATLVNPSSTYPTGAATASGISATIRTDERFYVATFGGYDYTMARSSTSKTGDYGAQDQWVEWKHVADVSEPLSATHSDTVRAFVNDRMVLAQIKTSGGNKGQHASSEKYDLSVGNWLIDYPATSTKSVDAMNTLAGGGAFSIGDTWWGSHFTINPPSSAGTNTYTYYIDDVEAYWIDALTMKAINANEYNGGKVVLEFNQKLREEVEYFKGDSTSSTTLNKLALKDMFKIVDAEGTEVPGGIEEFAVSADGKKVYIIPSEDLEKGVNYKIEVSPFLIDEYGQGLENNSKATYVDLKISENYVPFTVELSRDEIAGFDSGRDGITVTAKFSVAVDSENIENEIVAVNDETGAVATGWTYEFGKTEDGEIDYTTVIFDFAGLPKANYTVKSTDDFAAVNAATLANALEITIKAAAGPIILFDENFETGYAEGNLLTEANKNTSGTLSSSFTNYTIDAPDGKGSWDVQSLYTNASSVVDFFGVVDAPAEMEGAGKVLKVVNTRSHRYNEDYVAFRRNFDEARNAYRFDEGEYAGKVLVYEADVYAPTIKEGSQFMQPSTHKTTLWRYYEGFWKNGTTKDGNVRISGGTYQTAFANYGHVVAWQRSPLAGEFKTAPAKVKFAIDQSTELDTERVYYNGAMSTVSASKVAILEGHPMNDTEGRYDFGPQFETPNMKYAEQEWNMNTATQKFGTSLVGDKGQGTYGIYSQVSGAADDKTGLDTVYYFDNFKAYLVDAFDIEDVTGYGNNFNTEKGKITFTFSKKVDVTTAKANKNIVLLDKDGNEVADGIESVTAKDGGYQLEVKLSETLQKETEYTVWIKVGLRDCDGLSLRTQYSYYLYDIDAHYEKVTGKDNVYLITDVAKSGSIEGTYTPRVMDGDKVVTPAYLTYYKSDGTTVAATGATDMYVKDYAKMKSRISIVTAKSNSLSATATQAVVENGKVTTKVSFSNPETEAMSVWCIIAAFGEHDEMLGSKVVDIKSIEASSYTDEFEISFTTKAGKTVKSVKMFVWDDKLNMFPYQTAEDLMK